VRAHQAVLESDSVPATERYGAALGRVLRSGDVLVLNGPLGAGKTSLVRGIVAGAGGDAAAVRSPTFILHQPLRCARLTVHHVDLYRLGRGAAIDFLDLDGTLVEGAAVIEWGEYADLSELGPSTVWIDAPGPGQDRRVLSLGDGAARHVAEAWTALLEGVRAR
jgi:tRNA threonylcarbamoyladenosine biosynthesis protein TsaE